MCCTNLVEDQESDHVKRIAEFAMDAIQAANSTLVDTSVPDRGYVNIRAGFHSGSVVANVVGKYSAPDSNRGILQCSTGSSSVLFEIHSFLPRPCSYQKGKRCPRYCLFG